MNISEPIHVGIDVCKQRLDVALGINGATPSFTNDEVGVQDLCACLAERTVALVVVEATGVSDRHIGATR